MGKVKYIDKIRNFFKKSAVVNINSLKNFISDQKGNKEYVYLLINKMIKKGEIKRITKGYYSLHEDPVLAVFCFKPSYIGLQNALSIHNLWEQETNPVVITTRRIRQGCRSVFGSNVIIRRILPKYFFGVENIQEGNFFIPVSDIEKTFIDMIYFKQTIDKELFGHFKERIDEKRLKNYLEKYPRRISNSVTELFK